MRNIGNPRHVQKCRRPHPRHEGADLVEIAQRLLHQHRLDAAQRQRRKRGVNGILQAGVEQRRDAAQHARPQGVEIALHQIGQQHHQRKAQQGRDAAARNHPVVNLQHVERAGQHQQIDHAAEHGDAGHPPRAAAQAPRHRIIGRRCRRAGPFGHDRWTQAILNDTHLVCSPMSRYRAGRKSTSRRCRQFSGENPAV